MIIKRCLGGSEQEIELTDIEVSKAHSEYEKSSYAEDVRNKLDDVDTDELFGFNKEDLKENVEFIELVIERYEKYLSNDDSWNIHLASALIDILEDMK